MRSADDIESAFNRLVKPRIGRLGVYQLRRSHIAEMTDWIEDNAGPVMADKCRSCTRKALSWYAERDDQFNVTAAVVRLSPGRTKKSVRAPVYFQTTKFGSSGRSLGMPVRSEPWSKCSF